LDRAGKHGANQHATHFKESDVTPIAAPVPMRAVGVIRPLIDDSHSRRQKKGLDEELGELGGYGGGMKCKYEFYLGR